MLRELVKNYQAVEGAEVLFPQDKEVVGKCPRCGGNVTESGKGFFCENKDCQFALWKRKLTKEVAKKLLADGKVKLTGCYSERTGKKYDAVVILDDDGKRTSFMMGFEVKRRSMS